MKTINNEKISFEAQATTINGVPLFNADGTDLMRVIESSYAKLIMDCIKRPSSNAGFTYDEIESISKVKKAIAEEKEGQISLEDADFNFVKVKVASMTWGVPSEEFLKFKKYIESVK